MTKKHSYDNMTLQARFASFYMEGIALICSIKGRSTGQEFEEKWLMNPSPWAESSRYTEISIGNSSLLCAHITVEAGSQRVILTFK